MSDTAVQVEHLSKCYRIGLKEQMSETLGGAIGSWIRAPFSNLRRLRRLTRFDADESAAGKTVRNDLIWALSDVSFTVGEGEVIGIIGRNGAGKSTLLKILSRIVEPTGGRAIINGRVASLLEVGTGFHPELTGRENVYLNGAVLGMSKSEIDRKFDAIVAFADIEKFLDTPVKRYSSGMGVRLAFAVAAHLDPEILLIDEVLAVGDASFQKKCLGKMGEVATEGRTVIFVSHNMSAVSSLCSRCILLDNGKISQVGKTSNIISHYLAEGMSSRGKIVIKPDEAGGAKPLQFMSVSVENNNEETAPVPLSSGVDIQIAYRVKKSVERVVVVLELWDSNSNCVLSSTDMDYAPGSLETPRASGDYVANCHIPSTFLRPGRYYVSIWASIPRVKRVDEIPDPVCFDIFDDGSLEKKIGQGRRGVIAPLLNWKTEKTH